ncbi:MAG TPA: exosortase system-associated protein, TIGR04073 family [Verrucomicrobiota bacterium]|nr:exosortase system-associated protein, TIGR04073 family [Verrucomicrobiota bacterium]
MAFSKSVGIFAASSAMAWLTGCSSMEHKLGRGLANITEPIRLGELTRSTEQTYLADGPVAAQTYGVVHGISRTIQRTAVGVFDVVTFPIPTDPLIHPVDPVYPDSNPPRMKGGLGVRTDQYLGFQDTAVLPMVAGSDFSPLSAD